MPRERPLELLLLDIVERADAVAAALERLGDSDLEDDDVIRSAILWSLAIMGEAANRLPDDVRNAHPGVEWGRVIGFRNFVVHTYERIAGSIVEVTARERVPELRDDVSAILRSEYPLVARALDENNGEKG